MVSVKVPFTEDDLRLLLAVGNDLVQPADRHPGKHRPSKSFWCLTPPSRAGPTVQDRWHVLAPFFTQGPPSVAGVQIRQDWAALPVIRARVVHFVLSGTPDEHSGDAELVLARSGLLEPEVRHRLDVKRGHMSSTQRKQASRALENVAAAMAGRPVMMTDWTSEPGRTGGSEYPYVATRVPPARELAMAVRHDRLDRLTSMLRLLDTDAERGRIAHEIGSALAREFAGEVASELRKIQARLLAARPRVGRREDLEPLARALKSAVYARAHFYLSSQDCEGMSLQRRALATPTYLRPAIADYEAWNESPLLGDQELRHESVLISALLPYAPLPGERLRFADESRREWAAAVEFAMADLDMAHLFEFGASYLGRGLLLPPFWYLLEQLRTQALHKAGARQATLALPTLEPVLAPTVVPSAPTGSWRPEAVDTEIIAALAEYGSKDAPWRFVGPLPLILRPLADPWVAHGVIAQLRVKSESDDRPQRAMTRVLLSVDPNGKSADFRHQYQQVAVASSWDIVNSWDAKHRAEVLEDHIAHPGSSVPALLRRAQATRAVKEGNLLIALALLDTAAAKVLSVGPAEDALTQVEAKQQLHLAFGGAYVKLVENVLTHPRASTALFTPQVARRLLLWNLRARYHYTSAVDLIRFLERETELEVVLPPGRLSSRVWRFTARQQLIRSILNLVIVRRMIEQAGDSIRELEGSVPLPRHLLLEQARDVYRELVIPNAQGGTVALSTTAHRRLLTQMALLHSFCDKGSMIGVWSSPAAQFAEHLRTPLRFTGDAMDFDIDAASRWLLERRATFGILGRITFPAGRKAIVDLAGGSRYPGWAELYG